MTFFTCAVLHGREKRKIFIQFFLFESWEGRKTAMRRVEVDFGFLLDRRE